MSEGFTVTQQEWRRLVERVTEARDAAKATESRVGTLATLEQARHDDHERRIGKLEQAKAQALIIGGLLATVFTAVLGWIVTNLPALVQASGGTAP